jgi:hypothetical protein
MLRLAHLPVTFSVRNRQPSQDVCHLIDDKCRRRTGSRQGGRLGEQNHPECGERLPPWNPNAPIRHNGGAMKIEYLWLAGAGGVLSLLFLGLSLRLRRKQRLLRDLPTAKAQGVFIGLVELKGTAESEAPLSGFLSGHRACSITTRRRTLVAHRHRDLHRQGGQNPDSHQAGKRLDHRRPGRGIGAVLPAGRHRHGAGAARGREDRAGGTFFDQTCARGDPLYYAKGPPEAVANSDHRRRFVENRTSAARAALPRRPGARTRRRGRAGDRGRQGGRRCS